MEQDHKLMLWLRRVIGFSTMFVGPLVLLVGLWGNNYDCWYNAVSSAYWTNARNVFVLLFGTLGLFHVLYSGYDWIDKVMNLIVGIACFGLIIFPWKDSYALATEGLVQTFDLFPMLKLDSKNCTCNLIHVICGILLLTSYSINCLFIFTRSSGSMTDKKKLRNIIYRCCGIVIAVAFAFNTIIVSANHTSLGNYISIPQWFGMICEILETGACGFAWVVKGECLTFFND